MLDPGPVIAAARISQPFNSQIVGVMQMVYFLVRNIDALLIIKFAGIRVWVRKWQIEK
jgi:hypothetical protein